MINLFAKFAIAVAIAAPLGAQVRRPVSPVQLPPARSQTPAAPAKTGSFELDCVGISRLESRGFYFGCRQTDGTTINISVTRMVDETGEYAVGFEQSSLVHDQDEARLVEVSQTVTAFLLYKTVRPDSKAVLHVYGRYSKLPISLGQPVADGVVFNLD